MENILDTVVSAVTETGLSFRGAFHPVTEDGVPNFGLSGGPGTVVLVGNIGGSMWSAFDAGRRGEPDAMDRWTRRVLDGLLVQLNEYATCVAAVHPSDGPPYYPFQRWAMRAEPVHQSPIGPLIHPDYGLYHAYRGAFLFREVLPLPDRPVVPSPCDTCADKPCLNTCPVGAFTVGGYDTKTCANHLTTPEGDVCLARGCLARRACPVGAENAYGEAQARFHMELFRDIHASKPVM